jgi:SAM-dependent methyltransferase
MTPLFLRKAAGLLSPPLRRAASGAMLDLMSLPARLADPQRRGDPWQIVHNVGGGDFALAGRENLKLLIEHAGLEPDSRVLDIGCGTGRMAAPLAAWLNEGAGYVGFDVSESAISTCRRTLGSTRPDFQFVHADIRNREYRSGGSISETAFKFPAEDASVDVAFATSVFSHMTLDSITHYLAETRRVLKPGGRFMFTAYALTPERIAAIHQGQGQLAFKPWRDDAMVIDPKSPERAIAHPLSGLVAAIRQSELDLPAGVLFGGWLPPTQYGGGQDLFTACRPAV